MEGITCQGFEAALAVGMLALGVAGQVVGGEGLGAPYAGRLHRIHNDASKISMKANKPRL